MSTSISKGPLAPRPAAKLLWAAFLCDLLVVYLMMRLIQGLILAALNETGLTLPQFNSDLLNEAGRVAVSAVAFIVLLTLYWLVCETVLRGRTVGRACLMLDIRQVGSGNTPTLGQLASRAMRKFATFGFSGLTLRQPASHDARNGLGWWSPLGVSADSPMSHWRIKIASGSQEGSYVTLGRMESFNKERRILIGRDPNWSSLPLSREAQVSHRHAELRYDRGRWLLRESPAGARNGTFLNGKRLPKGQWTRVQVPTTFKIADVDLHFER